MTGAREPWGRFFLKVAVLLIVMVGAGTAFGARYRIGIDPQVLSCLPDKTVYLIDRHVGTLQRGRIYTYTARHMAPLFRDGERMGKILAALPGDVVEVTPDQDILVNGQTVGHGLVLAAKFHKPVSQFVGKATLGPDQYWFLGTSDLSFDSRYWGAVSGEQITGRVYGLF